MTNPFIGKCGICRESHVPCVTFTYTVRVHEYKDDDEVDVTICCECATEASERLKQFDHDLNYGERVP
jgi:hypothetical protein